MRLVLSYPFYPFDPADTARFLAKVGALLSFTWTQRDKHRSESLQPVMDRRTWLATYSR